MSALWCEICNCNVNRSPGNVNWKNHVQGFNHMELVKLAVARHKINKTKNEVTIALHDTCLDIVTFQESIGGKSTVNDSADSVASEFGDVISEDRIPAALSTKEEATLAYFLPKCLPTDSFQKKNGLAVLGASSIGSHCGAALLGHRFPSLGEEEAPEGVYLNTCEPFCFVSVGVQGAGKSHTSSCVLESCLVPFDTCNIVKLSSPMMTLVLHYDHNPSSLCEAAGLISPNASFNAVMSNFKDDATAAVPKSKTVVLVSPTFYVQRKKFYGDCCTVKPLLFRWHTLGADHIKRIMRINSGDNQLYVALFLDLLREYQRKSVMPEFSAFLDQVREKCNVKGQSGPLDQRIALLESVVAESTKNKALIKESLDLATCSKDDRYFIIADLTDPLLSRDEVNGLFQVLTEQFRALPTKGGKVLFLDEAHKYMSGEKADGLSEAIVNTARLMRHDGVRLVISTQSPKTLAPELLELVTVAALHHFHSPGWWNYLKSKLPLPQDAFDRILSLGSGEAVVFAASHDLSVTNVEGSHCLPIRVRPRLTEDLGSSRKNL